ncbi:cytochrome protein [Periconia macrospinosa]|uniref:Cytochrome protein n=1 Tax=Periconia macrospinosa TaxID=97972 RepID=A0A2V1E6R3_9PLEO|nr:cytochrome protein [Periconia macrospinosa]
MNDVFGPISKDFDDSDSLFCIDLWPFLNTTVLISSPFYAQQAELIVDRPDALLWSMHPVTGGPSLFAANGTQWKDTRNLLLPGFKSNYIKDQIIYATNEVEKLIEILAITAEKKELFQLDPVILKCMMNISGLSTFNKKLLSQTRFDAFTTALRRNMDWHYLGDALSSVARRTPIIGVINKYNSSIINDYLGDILDERYKEWRTGKVTSLPDSQKSTLDLILTDYIAKQKDKTPEVLDAAFKKWAIPQLRVMFFVGHDSGTATLSYTFYLLSKNPSALAKMRAEHVDVFGDNPSRAAEEMRIQPHLFNKIPYTTAVLKEVLRLFPPASGFRAGNAGDYLVDKNTGVRYPVAGTNIWILHSVLHKNPRYWKDASKFIPERFLVGNDDPLYPVKGAWRPFEHGPRDCIGQALVMTTMKVSLAMLARSFDVMPAYEEWDRLHGISPQKLYDGERAYLSGQSGAHPADGMPCRVSFRK